VYLLINTALRTSLHLHKNGSPFIVLKDSAATPYKGSNTIRFYNELEGDYYELYIKSESANIDISPESSTYTTWSGHFVSEA